MAKGSDPSGKEWQEKLGFLTPKYVESFVGEHRQKFYPVSGNLLFKLSRQGSVLVKSLSVLFQSNDRDFKTIDRQFHDPETKGINREVIIEEVKLETAKYRDEQRTKAITDAFACLTDPENLDLLGEIIMDSLRDVFPREPKERCAGKELFEGTPLPQITELFWGVVKANKDVLGPLASRVEALTASFADTLTQKVENLSKEKAAPVPVPLAS